MLSIGNVVGTTQFPVYQVTFWSFEPARHSSIEDHPSGLLAERWQLSEARDYAEVENWARLDGRAFEAFAVFGGPEVLTSGEIELVRLSGYNPALGAGYSAEDFISNADDLGRVQEALRSNNFDQ